MTIQLVIEPEAEAELEEAADRYEESVPGLGAAFLEEMRQRTLDVLALPHTFPALGSIEGVRCAHAIGRFPHLVVYMCSDTAVHVLAFVHPRRRPGYWTKRLQK